MSDLPGFLIFDSHASTEEVTTFEAMATVTEARWPALQAELASVLAWCHAWGGAHGAAQPGALDEGGEWDHELLVTRELSETLTARFEPQHAEPAQALALAPAGDVITRWIATLTVSGRDAFAADFQAQFLRD